MERVDLSFAEIYLHIIGADIGETTAQRSQNRSSKKTRHREQFIMKQNIYLRVA